VQRAPGCFIFRRAAAQQLLVTLLKVLRQLLDDLGLARGLEA
jgi:hypothetical protein